MLHMGQELRTETVVLDATSMDGASVVAGEVVIHGAADGRTPRARNRAAESWLVLTLMAAAVLGTALAVLAAVLR